MKEKILTIISKISKKDIAFLKDNMTSCGLWTSLSHVELILLLEEEFNLILEDEEMTHMYTPQDILDILSKKVGI